MDNKFGGLGPETDYTSKPTNQINKRSGMTDTIRNGNAHPSPNIAKNSLVWLILNLFFVFPIGLVGAYWALKSMLYEYRNDIEAAKMYNSKARKFFVVWIIILIVCICLKFVLSMFDSLL